MKTSRNGINLIKEFEGFRSKPYLCSAGVPTIGWGSTYYPSGKKVTLEDKPITTEEGEKLLSETLVSYENIVNRRVTVPITQNQFDALVCHTFNTGGSAGLFTLINNRAELYKIRQWWTTKYITAAGVRLAGLVRRREAEYKLYIS